MICRWYQPPLPGRDIADFLASDMIGVAATRVEDRIFAAIGIQKSDISFDACESVEYGGLLFFASFPFSQRPVEL